MAKTGFEAICRIQHILNERLFDEAKTEYASLAVAVRDFKSHRYEQWKLGHGRISSNMVFATLRAT